LGPLVDGLQETMGFQEREVAMSMQFAEFGMLSSRRMELVSMREPRS